MKNRKEIENEIISWLDKFDLSGKNSFIHKQMFEEFDDEKFLAYLDHGITLYDPNNGGTDIDHMRTIEICKEFGHDFEQQLWLTCPKTGITSLTPNKHIVMPQLCRLQTQRVDKKRSVAEHNRTFDKMTGQVTGDSKASAFSFPQIYLAYSKGYDKTLKEFTSIRGGNQKAGNVVDRQIRQQGKSSQDFMGVERTVSKSPKTAGILFKAIHIGNNFGQPKV